VLYDSDNSEHLPLLELQPKRKQIQKSKISHPFTAKKCKQMEKVDSLKLQQKRKEGAKNKLTPFIAKTRKQLVKEASHVNSKPMFCTFSFFVDPSDIIESDECE
jgi:hypothetical protein